MKANLSLALLLAVISITCSEGKAAHSRIIGGTIARSEQFPYAAAIYKTTQAGQYFYSGAVISNQWILTSGQAVVDALLFKIQIGSNSLGSTDSNRLTLATSEYVLHPDYNGQTLENDIGAIELRMPITFTDHIQVTYLPSTDIDATAPATAIGWGQISDDTSAPVDSLEYVLVSTVSNDECKLTYGNQITDTMLCIEGNYNEGSCYGDMGAPLVQYMSARYTVIVGIASFVSYNGCESTDPSGFTRVYPYLEWVRNVTGVH